ncbi:phage tail protein [Edwardsiella tarda]|uniref:phage tail-collar fiber domain-containing protein n=1 Tax=Edwardsiella tarda TaxID=636 RepID=UPI00351BEF5C
MMSQAAITLAFEKFKAQEAAGGRTLILDEFVLANVPGLDPSAPIDRNEGMPPAGQIVHRQAVNTTGVVNEHAVAYSITMGTEVGDFDFNWLGLVNKATGLLAMVVHVPTQRKIANAAGQQGNALTRSFLMEFDGAAAATGITTPAETWQIDFTARLHGMDEMQRLANRDLYGAGAFFGDGFLVVRQGAGYTATAGIGYIGGLRAELTGNKPLSIGSKPTKVWADVSLQGNVTSAWETVVALTVAETMVDYVDQGGFAHYVFAVAGIDAAGTVTDLRPKGSTTDQASQEAAQKLRDDLDAHVRSRNHPDATLADKGFVRLYSGVDSNDETKAATPKAVKVAMDNANGRLSKTGGTVTGDVTVVGRVATNSFTDKKTHIGQDYLSYITLSDWAKPIGASEMCRPDSTGAPNGFTGGYWNVLGRRDAGGGYAGLLCGFDTADIWFGFNRVGGSSPVFARIYTERYKPTPSDIGALDKNQNGADIQDKQRFINNLGLRGTVDLADGAFQKSGGTVSGNINFDRDTWVGWNRNSDYAKIGFKNEADSDTDSYLWFEVGDNGNEYFKWRRNAAGPKLDLMNLKEDGLSVFVDAHLKALSVDSQSGSWLSMRQQCVLFGRNPVINKSAQALLRQDHSDRKFFVGGIGGEQFGLYMIRNDRVENSYDAAAFLDKSGNWACSAMVVPSDYRNFDGRYVSDVKLGAEYSKGYGASNPVKANSGSVLTGLQEYAGDNEIHTYFFKPIQVLKNGSWITIAG